MRDLWGNEFCVLHPNFPELLAGADHGLPNSGNSIGVGAWTNVTPD